MMQRKFPPAIVAALSVTVVLGCASTGTQESPAEYVDDAVITARVKVAIYNEPSLKSSEIQVETVKGAVQLSGFVRPNISVVTAIELAHGVSGVNSVDNNMQLK